MTRYALPLLAGMLVLPGQPMLKPTEPPPFEPQLVGFVPGVGTATDVIARKECEWLRLPSGQMKWTRVVFLASVEFGLSVVETARGCGEPPMEAFQPLKQFYVSTK